MCNKYGGTGSTETEQGPKHLDPTRAVPPAESLQMRQTHCPFAQLKGLLYYLRLESSGTRAKHSPYTLD